MKIIIYIIFGVLFFLIIFGFIYSPSPSSILIDPGSGIYNKKCIVEKVSCNTNEDCENVCIESGEGESMICQSIPPIEGLTEEQKKLLGITTNLPPKYCIPEKSLASLKNCNYAHGGMPVFNSWSGLVSDMDFTCMCMYPMWASSRICDSKTGNCKGTCLLNPDICKGGTFNWDLTKKVETPTANLCKCAEGDKLVIDNNGLPKCVPEETTTFYDDLDVSTGVQGGQSIIPNTSVKMTSINKLNTCKSPCSLPQNKDGSCPESCDKMTGIDNYSYCVEKTDNFTKCDNGCCRLPNAVCCNSNFCCPQGYTCDNVNNLCIRNKCCLNKEGKCEGNTCCNTETTCSNGCCPIKDGICCENGCCPKTFPICDNKNKVCNPKGTKLTKGKCSDPKNNTQCDNGCCSIKDGTCCGEFCCPPEYPYCDIKNSGCSMFPIEN